ncbi:hypothetical protein AURDEDRAFT_170176 [Auricularia subglabra TFB-10046 SS5]|nr:hypothetical protein AURDEDRAFT_170176 [Auricularia subglabra TFB-10046 SS5]
MTYLSKDLPAAVRIILAHAADFAGADVAVADHKLTPADMARIAARVSGRTARAVYDPTYLADVPAIRENLAFRNSPYVSHYAGFPFPHPLLAKYGFKAAPFEDFVQEKLLPHLGLSA